MHCWMDSQLISYLSGLVLHQIYLHTNHTPSPSSTNTFEDSAMATARRLPSWVVLDRVVRFDEEAVEKESEWAIIECTDRKSYIRTCQDVPEEDVDSLVRGMTLLARLTDPPDLSALCIRLRGPIEIHHDHDGVVFGEDGLPERFCRDIYVNTADEKLIVLTFTTPNPSCSHYYLIYDATKKSLSAIPYLRVDCSPSYTMRPLPVRRGDGDGGYSLAIMARVRDYDPRRQKRIHRDVLCLWPPPESPKPPPPSLRIGVEPWRTKQTYLPSELPPIFKADTVFSFKGQAFWTDLGQGVLYCNCEDVLSGDDYVQFHYVQLPPECRLDIEICVRGAPEMYRTMSGVGDSIKFVSVGDGRNSVATGDTMVTMWALTPATGEWRKLEELRVASLWEQEGFKKAGLPETLPLHPILSTQQDGVLYFLLLDDNDSFGGEAGEQYVVSLDMRSKSFLSSKPLPFRPYPTESCLLGLDFFKYLENQECLCPLVAPSPGEAEVLPSPDPRKRKLPSSLMGD